MSLSPSPVALVMAVAALLGALVALAFTANDPTAAAEARVRLHDNVDWPEHDAVRLEILSWLDDETFNAADNHVGGALHALDAELPKNQSFLNVVAKADDDASAVAALDLAVARLIARDDAFTLDPFRNDLASAQASLDSVTEELAAATAAVEAGDPNAGNEQGSLTWRLEELEDEVDDAERILASRTARIYQIGETKTSDAQRFRRLRIIAASALVTALAAGAALSLVPKVRPNSDPDLQPDLQERDH